MKVVCIAGTLLRMVFKAPHIVPFSYEDRSENVFSHVTVAKWRKVDAFLKRWLVLIL